MKHFLSLGLLAALTTLAAAAPAPTGVAVKFRENREGDVVLVEQTEKSTVTFKIVDADNKELASKAETTIKTAAYKETTLKRAEGKRPTKLEREYTKAELTKDGVAATMSFEGKTVVIEKKGDKYTYTIKDGQEVPAEEAEFLEKEFKDMSDDRPDYNKLMLPAVPVKVGEEWKIDVASIAKDLAKNKDIEVDAAKATAVGTLVKQRQQEDRPFGEVHFKMNLPVKTLGKGDEKFQLNDGAKMIYDVTMDYCIDASLDTGKTKGRITFEGTGTSPLFEGGTMHLSMDVELQETHKDQTKK